MRLISRLLLPALLGTVMVGACSGDNGGPVDPTPPAPPSGLAAQALGSTSVEVTFTPVSGATRYVVQRAEGATGGTFAVVGNPTTPPFTDVGLLANTTYRYQVATVSGSETSEYSAAVTVTTQDKPVETITQNITANTTWTSDKQYLLQGFIKVTNGATLTIEAGTIIRGDFNTVGSSLFVLRGARIQALGTAQSPIVFTSSRPAGQRQAGDWGGLIIVGNGIINRGQPVILEGTGTGAANPAVDYSGGTNNADNSGTLRYVRIEFAGFATAPDAELNTLTLAAVGSGTTVEYVQGLNGLDDTFEWFGGAVDSKYLISYNAGDDHFDASEGYVGRNQFVIGFQQVQVVPRPQAGNVSNDPQGFENDGCAGANCLNGQTSQPYNIPMFANFTLVGPPAGVNTQGSGNIGMMLRRGTGGFYVNGVVARWSRAAISLRDQPTLDRITAGDLVLGNLLLAENGAVFQPQTGATVQGTVDQAANNIESVAGTASSLFTALPASPTTTTLDWTPAVGSPARVGGLATFAGAVAAKAGGFVTGTTYRGAADPNGAKWWQGWTNYAEN
ncbi:MAG: fibronectin type III domain-containing protein [Gemmatimonadales bacterium]